MNNTLLDTVAARSKDLMKFGFSVEEFAALVQENNMTDAEVHPQYSEYDNRYPPFYGILIAATWSLPTGFCKRSFGCQHSANRC